MVSTVKKGVFYNMKGREKFERDAHPQWQSVRHGYRYTTKLLWCWLSTCRGANAKTLIPTRKCKKHHPNMNSTDWIAISNHGRLRQRTEKGQELERPLERQQNPQQESRLHSVLVWIVKRDQKEGSISRNVGSSWWSSSASITDENDDKLRRSGTMLDKAEISLSL